MKKQIAVFLLSLCALVQAADPMNFVVIFSDEMPPEYVGAYGQGKYPTPNIDQLAHDGQRFNNGFSVSPMCTPARFAVMTGRWPARCGAPSFLKEFSDPSQPCMISWNTQVTPNQPTLARALGAQGYNTGIAGKWHLTGRNDVTHLELPYNAAMDDPATQKVLAEQQVIDQKTIMNAGGFTHARNVFLENVDAHPLPFTHNIPWITKGAVQLLNEFAGDDKPFCLFVTPTGIHGPWHADVLDADLRNTLGGREDDVYDYAPDYAALKETVKDFTSGEKHKHVGMADLDHQVGVIRAELEKLGLAENTAVIFTADHGIEPGKASVYDRGMRVPFIVYWPGATKSGSVTDALAQHVDITATIAAAANVPDIGKLMDGVDLRPVLKNPKASVRDVAYFECGYSRGVTDGHYKLISVRLPDALIAECEAGKHKWLTVGMGAGNGKHAAFSQMVYPGYYDPDQLYDLKKDPYEQQSVFANPEYASEQKKLRAALSAVSAGLPNAFPEEPQPFFATDTYKELTERTRRENNPMTKEWVKRDHDQIIWPPAHDGGGSE